MNSLVIGKGGREHALARALSFSSDSVYVIPGNCGMRAKNIFTHSSIQTDEFEKLYQFIKDKKIDLVIIGPEKELTLGLSDFLRKKDVLVVGCCKESAQLEGSKLFSKQFMKEVGVPTAFYKQINSFKEALGVLNLFKAPYVLKADGLCGGKGVMICKDKDELKKACDLYFEKKIFGDQKVFLEQFQEGSELSYLILTNGEQFEKLPFCQDHKAVFDQDKGPNTGGMGVVSPVSIDPELDLFIEKNIVQKILKEMKKRKWTYYGAFYIGLMIKDKKASVLEFNVRFGDPEAQSIFPLAQTDWTDLFFNLAKGKLKAISWSNKYSCCVVLSSSNYPDSPQTGFKIEGDLFHETDHSYFLSCGVKKNKDQFETASGRVINSVALASSLKQAIDESYLQIKKINFKGMHFRKDIGRKALN